MTDPIRLLQSHIDEDARSVLEAARRAEPSVGVQAEIWQSIALGLPAGVLLGAATSGSADAATVTMGTITAATEETIVTTVASGAASAVASGAASAVAGGAASAAVSTTAWAASGLGTIAGKAVAIGFGVGLAVHVGTGLGGRAFDSVRSAPAASASSALQGSSKPRATPARAVPPSLPQPSRASDGPASEVRLTPTEPAAAAQATNGALPADTRGLEIDELRDESALLLRARSALQASDGTSALDALLAYRRRFPRGKLTQEHDALEIQVLVELGRRDDARDLARAFLGRYPGSPHAERIRAVTEAIR